MFSEKVVSCILTTRNITNRGERGAKMLKVGQCTMGLRESANCDSMCPVWKELRLDGKGGGGGCESGGGGREHKAVSRASEKGTWEGRAMGGPNPCTRGRRLQADCLPEGQLGLEKAGTKSQKRFLCALSVQRDGSRLSYTLAMRLIRWSNIYRKTGRKVVIADTYRAGMLAFAAQITFPTRLNVGK